MILSKEEKIRSKIYCWHTQPRFYTLHFDSSDEKKDKDYIKIRDKKVSNGFIVISLVFIFNTVWLIFSIINPITKFFGRSLIETKKDEIIDDLRCEHCKRPI